MAKKETTTKKSTKRTAKKRVTVKKVKADVIENNVEQDNSIKENQVILDNVDVERIPESDEEFKEQVLKHVASEILVEKNNSLEEYMNTPQEEIIDKAKEKIENIKKINNQEVNNRIDHLFGYLWNGQEMDY